MIAGLHVAVKVSRRLNPIDFKGAITCGQHRFHLNRDRIRLCSLEWWIIAIVVADERLGAGSTRYVCVDSIYRSPLGDAVRRHHSDVLDPVLNDRTAEAIVTNGSLFCKTGGDWAAQAIDEDDERDYVRPCREPDQPAGRHEGYNGANQRCRTPVTSARDEFAVALIPLLPSCQIRIVDLDRLRLR